MIFFSSGYVRSLEAEVERLRHLNTEFLNRILLRANLPMLDQPKQPEPRAKGRRFLNVARRRAYLERLVASEPREVENGKPPQATQ